ncbi:trigger factor [Thermodesulfovibrionales bacterium]|nr:trigger factor [Thermodesulfovibrionales bacterium]
MLKELEDISSTKKRLKIEIPAEEIETEIQTSLNNVRNKSVVPGFRLGKAPMGLIEKKFRKDVEADVLEKAVPEFYRKAIKEADITPVSEPVIEESLDFKRDTPLVMTIRVEVMPKLGTISYEGITVKEIPVEVSEEEINAALNIFSEERATYESSDETIKLRDIVTVDYTTNTDDGPAKDVILKVGSSPYPGEFFDGLIGRRKGEEFGVEASFDGESQLPFAGKRVKFTMKVKDVKKCNIPAIDDEFARDLGLESLELLRDKIRENIAESKNRAADNIKQNDILNKLIESYDFEVPESILNGEVDRVISKSKKSDGENLTDEGIKKEIIARAEKDLKALILLKSLGEAEGITISDEDIKKEVFYISQKYHTSPKSVIEHYMKTDGSLEELNLLAFKKKVLNFLLSKVSVDSGIP